MLTVEQRHQLVAPVFGGLRSIGYRPGLIQRDYSYVDLFSDKGAVREVDIAAFGQEPFDYRSACIAIRVAAEPTIHSEDMADLRSLGAPHVLVVTPSITQQWIIRERNPVCSLTFPTTEIDARIKSKESEWNPSTVLRAKSGFTKPSPEQTDFVDIGLLPVLDTEAGKKIDRMVSRVLHTVEIVCKQRNESFDAHAIFNVLFRFLAAKLLKDRSFNTDPEIDFSKPISTLQAVDNHYHSKKLLVTPSVSDAVLESIAAETASSFSFRNISVDTLTYVYENTFVSPASRRELGIHSTPSYVADYILSQIPIEQLPREQWNFLDPTCGHGIFLIAAMRRIRHLLPADWGSQRRHQFFVDHLRGVDIEAFSIEVARLCLMLADFPEPNGWNLKCEDVFAEGALERAAESVSILVGNPPFEKLPNVTPHKPAPAELLDRTLDLVQPGGFIGLVLPKSFQDSVDYGKQRNQLLRSYDVLSLTSLPDRVFIHSDAETVVLVAQRRQKEKAESFVSYRTIGEKDRISFAVRQQITWEDKVPQSFFENNIGSRLVVPALRPVWERLVNSPQLGEIADIRKGVEYDTSKLGGKYENAIFDEPRQKTVPGVHGSTSAFTQYVLFKQQHFNTDPELKRRDAWNYNWEQPKVIAPAARLSRGPWRFAAIVDRKGLIASRLHYAFWSKDSNISVEAIAAILNSPIGAAYAYSHGSQKTVAKRTYESIPLPELRILHEADSHLKELVEKYAALLQKPLRNEHECLEALLSIDAFVLKLYGLPPKLERQLLDLFWGAERRVPILFSGYIPPEIKSWIPLWMYLSPAYAESSVEALWKRLPDKLSQESLRILQNIGMEDHD
jgi:hypothetical protein